ncbi:MFS transporter [Marmoricola endophyticus]|uniref:Putative proline/betaine transporter n=1 Tax=Marmoricola endophyticus TaxID=2040280 RepID=A0A917F9I8_9ACTN|nr:MFS transporter [Marmoricola endophyticus]GGF55629.1 MFS transporter [Marmoricola endophyticus]
MSTTERPTSPDQIPAAELRRAVYATSIGNTLEWFDFAVYGYMAVVLGDLFFPSDNPTASLLLSLAAFAASFLVRPLGGAFFGPLGDKLGRRGVLCVIVVSMSAATFCIGLLPTYATIGVAAPVLLVALRLIGGFTAGGEVTGATTMIAEYAPVARRGFVTSWIQMSATLGFFLGLAAPTVLSLFLTDDQVSSWGWRLPFLVAGPLGVIGLYIRLRLRETPDFESLREEGEVAKNPLTETLVRGWREVVLAGGLGILVHLGYFMSLVYMPTYLTNSLDFSASTAFLATTTVVLFDTAVIPFAGRLSDRVGRKPVMLAGAAGFIVLTLPIFLLVRQGGAATFVALAVLGALHGTYLGGVAAAFPEVFATRVRFGGFSIGHNVSAAIFGGGTPLLAAYLGDRLGTTLMPAYLITVGGLLCLVAVTRYQEMAGRPLPTTRPSSSRRAATAVRTEHIVG